MLRDVSMRMTTSGQPSRSNSSRSCGRNTSSVNINTEIRIPISGQNGRDIGEVSPAPDAGGHTFPTIN